MKDLAQFWTDFSIKDIEAAIQAMLPWDVGGSRLGLWCSAISLFLAWVTIPATIFGWVVGKVVGYFYPTPSI